jgi:Carboxypeptidase regulatory-like domain/TonB dependent receptor/TonB-dependent Receptor Plug Domain
MKKLGVFLVSVFCLFASVPAGAQVTGATLSGTVTDATGAVVANAQVSIRNTATGAAKDTTTDTAGYYSAPNLTPGIYEVKITAAGFSTAVRSNLELAVGAQQQLNITLKVGETSTTVQVTEAAPQVELTSSTLTGQVESETVRELPLNGRDWTSLAVLQPGVKPIETQMSYDTSARGNRGFGSELTVSGQRSTFNNYRIDGISVVDYANAAPGNVIGVVLGVDAIQEFSVLTGGFSAEYGRATGGVVNAISKSGTNSFHGDAYEFLRNSALDANDYFTKASGAARPPFRRNQFGESAGGPIIKNKLFIFGDYEGLRQSLGVPTTIVVPSDAARGGTLAFTPVSAGGSGPPAGCTVVGTTNTCTVTVNSYTAALLNGMYPHANSNVSGNTGNFVFAGKQLVPENFYTARVDYKLGNNDSLFGTYVHDDTDYTQPDKMDTVITDSHTTRQTVAIEETHTFNSSLLNAVRIGYNRDHVVNAFPISAVPGTGGADPTLASTTGQFAPRVSVAGIADTFGGVGANSHYLHTWNSYQGDDDMFWTHGTHTIKFGGGVEWMPYDFEAFQEPGGRWKFNSLTTYLEGIPQSFEAGLPNTVSPREFRQTLYALYINDDWKIRSNLTLNLGLRYETTTVLGDSQGKIGSLVNIVDPNPNSTAPSDLRCATNFTGFPGITAQPGTTCDSIGPYYSNPTHRNFEPRVGFAWDPFHNGKTSVRGGFGIYDVLPLPGYFILQQNQAAPFMVFKSIGQTALQNVGTSLNPGGPFQAGEGQTILTTLPSSRLAASTIEPNPHRSYVMQWNLNVQRQIMSDTTLTVGYVGSHGVHLLMRGDDGNMTQPAFVPGVGFEFPCGFVNAADTFCTPGDIGGTLGAGGATSAQLNQALGVIRYIYWGTDSFYHALNINLAKSIKHGFQFQVAYTLSKSLDDDSQTIAGDTFANGLNSPIWMIPKAFKGPSDFNVTHTLSINGLWDLPGPKTGVGKTALGGWELGSILTINSGIPTTPEIANDPLGLGNTGADQFGLPNFVQGCNPTNPGFAGSAPGAPQWINVNCYTLPTVPTSILGSLPFPCANFSGAATLAPAGQTYCANLLGNTGRNSIYGPHFFNWDFSVLKNFPVKRISEAFNVQFRAEMFDITNHANFGPPQPGSGDTNSQLFNPNGSRTGLGFISQYATNTPSRQIQFALKVIW